MAHRILLPILPTATAGFVLCCSMTTAQNAISANPSTAAPAGLTQYMSGEPSGDEVEMLELVNRARANPAAEGQRLAAGINPASYGIGSGGSTDLQNLYWSIVNEICTSFASYPTRPPLAFNAELNASAQAHVADMIATGVRQHNSSNGASFEARIESFGYTAVGGENVAGEPYYDPPFVVTPDDSESGYETDIDNAEPGYGHRLNVMEPTFPGHVEVGIAQRALGGWNTEDFGNRNTSPLLTGVVFADNAGTAFYVSGEGVGGVIVTAPGFSSYYAVTGTAGAYTLPLDLAGSVYAAGAAYAFDPSTGKYVYSPANASPSANVTFTDFQGKTVTQAVKLTHTEILDPGAANPTTGFTGVSAAYYDGSGIPRWDNAEANLVLPASAVTTPPPTPAPSGSKVSITPLDGSMASFTLVRIGDTARPLTVHYLIKGSAAAGTDYLPLPGRKVIKAGKTSARIRVSVLPRGKGTLKLKLVGTDVYDVGSPRQAKWRLPGSP